MVIRLTIGAQIGGALRYNEQKVVQKQAHVLGATGFANNELAEKSRRYAANVLESQAKKNANVKKPTLHFSLSLHPTEQVSDDKFKAMANQFMAEMGYQHQPYMVYRHHDTAHPHIHIVTTCVDETGYKINDSFIKRRTNAVRQQLELRFGLIKAQGRGKGKTTEQIRQARQVQVDEVTPRQAQPTSGFDMKDQLEAILRETVQQATFNNLDEFETLLKKQHIHTVLHLSSVAGKAFRGISYQFTDEAGKPATPRIKASEIGTWATWKEIEKQFGKRGQQQGQGPSTELTYEKYKVLASILSDDLQTYKKQQSIYYDSALIENFPSAAMQARLQAITQHKLSEGELIEAVRRFEAYKCAQLPEIVKKEQLAFTRTMGTYTQIAGEIRGSAQNKNDFFSALSAEITVDGLITSPTNRHVAYQIGRAALERIQTGDGPELTMPTLYSRGERTVMLLSESKKPFKESYYNVRAEHLKRILKPERMSSIHAQLNANYVARLLADGPVLGVDQVRYFYQRGIVLDPPQLATGKTDNESTFTIRYYQAPLQAAVPAGELFEKQIPHLHVKHWQKGLSTEAGRYMVALAQLIDQGKRGQAKNGNEKSNDLAFLRERIHQCDPALVMFSDEDLVSVLEKRSLQGKGWIKQTDLESKQETNAYMNESALHTPLLTIRAADVFGYEQTGKYKKVGKGIKKRDKGREQ